MLEVYWCSRCKQRLLPGGVHPPGPCETKDFVVRVLEEMEKGKDIEVLCLYLTLEREGWSQTYEGFLGLIRSLRVQGFTVDHSGHVKL